ncbi:hypothetical protein Tco_0218637 [Tanacetum coccineum]
MDIVPRLESRVKYLEKELSETKQTLGIEIFKLNEKVKELEDKLRKNRKSKETIDAQGQDQDVPSQTDQGDTFATSEKSKGSGEAQEEQISPSTLEAAQILTNVASEGFKGSQAPLGSKIYKRKSKSTKTPTKILHLKNLIQLKLILLKLILLNLILIVHLQLKLILVRQKGFKGEKERSPPSILFPHKTGSKSHDLWDDLLQHSSPVDFRMIAWK